ncbi:hypothetical protein OH77DRAFT_859057 [Trametes cingulata]|nr:hypothetical protein OH77DRAFT_859057 [Trametes cingulata]
MMLEIEDAKDVPFPAPFRPETSGSRPAPSRSVTIATATPPHAQEPLVFRERGEPTPRPQPSRATDAHPQHALVDAAAARIARHARQGTAEDADGEKERGREGMREGGSLERIRASKAPPPPHHRTGEARGREWGRAPNTVAQSTLETEPAGLFSDVLRDMVQRRDGGRAPSSSM